MNIGTFSPEEIERLLQKTADYYVYLLRFVHGEERQRWLEYPAKKLESRPLPPPKFPNAGWQWAYKEFAAGAAHAENHCWHCDAEVDTEALSCPECRCDLVPF